MKKEVIESMTKEQVQNEQSVQVSPREEQVIKAISKEAVEAMIKVQI